MDPGRGGRPPSFKKKRKPVAGVRSPRIWKGRWQRPLSARPKGRLPKDDPTPETIAHMNRVLDDMETDPMSPGGIPQGRLVDARTGRRF